MNLVVSLTNDYFSLCDKSLRIVVDGTNGIRLFFNIVSDCQTTSGFLLLSINSLNLVAA